MKQYLIKGYDTYYRYDCQYQEHAEFANEQEAWQYCDEIFADYYYRLYQRNQNGTAVEISKT
jgi:hypothetical protein